MNNFLLYFDDEENAMDSIYEDPILKQNTTFDRPTFIFDEDAQIAGLGNIRICIFLCGQFPVRCKLYHITLLLRPGCYFSNKQNTAGYGINQFSQTTGS